MLKKIIDHILFNKGQMFIVPAKGKALDKAKWWLHEIVESHRCTPISTAEMALKQITALEQKDVK